METIGLTLLECSTSPGTYAFDRREPFITS
jgi:hypothetical protein